MVLTILNSLRLKDPYKVIFGLFRTFNIRPTPIYITIENIMNNGAMYENPCCPHIPKIKKTIETMMLVLKINGAIITATITPKILAIKFSGKSKERNETNKE
jgi:hypothetical protein